VIVFFVLDPVCEIVKPAVWGESVTLRCRMTYDWQSPARQFNAPPELSVSLSWNSVPDTTVKTTADPTVYRGTVETNMTLENVTSEVMPSYACNVQFDFSLGRSPWYKYADNSVSSSCATPPSRLWCKYNLTAVIWKLKVPIQREDCHSVFKRFWISKRKIS